jgi:RIO kinase 1
VTQRHQFNDDLADDEDLSLTSAMSHRAHDRRNPAARRAGRPPAPRPTATVSDLNDPRGDFETTYRPARFEKEWLREALLPFYDQRLIVDVLTQVRGGKEANVYCCRAHPELGGGLVAAKVYRPQRFRNLRNDAIYRENRSVLTGTGQPISALDARTHRALAKKTDYGLAVRHTSWVMHEYTTLQRLHAAGGAAPEPLAAGDNTIIMGYVGEVAAPAPTLNGVRLAPEEAGRWFDEVLRTVEVLLGLSLIHGDLSAYNILYWQGAITLIDFPQVTDSLANPHAQAILRRDIARLCGYFAQQGHRRDPAAIAEDLWQRYVVANGGDPDGLPLAPLSELSDEEWPDEPAQRWLDSRRHNMT